MEGLSVFKESYVVEDLKRVKCLCLLKLAQISVFPKGLQASTTDWYKYIVEKFIFLDAYVPASQGNL